MGELPCSGDITDRPDARRRPAALIDVNATVTGLDAHRFEAQIPNPWAASGGHHEPGDLEILPVGKAHTNPGTLTRHTRDLRANPHLDALVTQEAAEQLPYPGLLSVQQPRAGLDQAHPTAVARQHLPQLDAHRPAAQHCGAFGDLAKRQRLAVGPVSRRLQALDRRGAVTLPVAITTRGVVYTRLSTSTRPGPASRP